MKIAFVCSEDKWLGVGYLSSYLKKFGHQTYLLFDPLYFNKAYLNIRRLKYRFSLDSRFLKELAKIKPDLIGFSVVTANYQWALQKAALLKKNFNIPIIFGGPHPTIVPDEVINNDVVDMIALGEAEESLLELANEGMQRKSIRGIWYKEANNIIKNPLQDLITDIDKYPFPDDDLFYRQLPASYRLTPSVITSRGCPFSCTYCGNQLIQKLYRDSGFSRWVRQRSVANVIAELEWRKKAHKSRHFVFMDDIFSARLTWLKEFVREYKKKINLPLNCLSHPSLVQEATVKLLKEAGCTLVDFGLQSGSAKVRKEILNRHESNEKVTAVGLACKKHKLRFAIDCILNLPGENEATQKESLAFLNSLRPDIINCFGLIYFPGTKIVEIAKKACLIEDSDIDLINQGKMNNYSSIGLADKKHARDDYERFVFLTTSIPLFPKKCIEAIINNKALFNLFQKMPLIFLPLVKVIVQLKGGFGFIFFNVVKNELFYLNRYFISPKRND